MAAEMLKENTVFANFNYVITVETISGFSSHVIFQVSKIKTQNKTATTKKNQVSL